MGHDHDGIDWERLDRYITGQGTPEELATLKRWVDSDPELRALADAMQTAGRPPDAAAGAWDTRAAWRRVRRGMRLLGRPPLRIIKAHGEETRTRPDPPRHGRPPARSGARRPLAAAAVLVVALGSALAVWRSATPPSGTVAVEMREVTTGRGQRSVLDLPDGSRVMLAPESRLRVPVRYSATRGSRNLYLEGQAHFDVEHDGTRPFRVHAANGIAEDLGTEFVVTAYPETGGMEVLVASGIVALHARGPAEGRAAEDEAAATPEPDDPAPSLPLLTLTRGDLAHLDSAATATLTRGVDPAARLAWTRGRLVFDGARFGEAIPVLERWYDIKIRLADDALADRRLTTTLGGEPFRQVLELLALSLELDIQQSGQSVMLTAKNGSSRSP